MRMEMQKMSEHIKCDACGGHFLEDHGACDCDRKEIMRLKGELRDLERIFYAHVMGDVEDLPKRLQKKAKKMTGMM